MFREIKLSDQAWIERCRDERTNALTVLSFPAVYTWQSSFGLTIDGDEDYYIIRSEADQGYYYPVGSQEAVRGCISELLQKQGSLKLIYVPESELKWLEELGAKTRREPDSSEYVYRSSSLALNDRDSGKNYREKVRHFSRDNKWKIRSFHFPEDNEFLKQIAAAPDREKRGSYSNLQAMRRAAEHPLELDLSGVYIETVLGEWAFLLGYPSTSQIYDLTFLSYSISISRNVVPACICELAKRVCDRFPLINMEDDMGIEGLRTMKKLYHPVFMLDSYTAVL